MKLPKMPAGQAEKITEVISKNLKKKESSKDVNLAKLAKKMSGRRNKILKEDGDDNDQVEKKQ